MAFEIDPQKSEDGLPNVAVPGVNYAAVRNATGNANSLAARIEQKVRKSLAASLEPTQAVVESLATKVATPIVATLDQATFAMDDLRGKVQNQLKGSLQPAIATAMSLAAGGGQLPAGGSRAGAVAPSGGLRVASSLPAPPTGGPGAMAAGQSPPPAGGVCDPNTMSAPEYDACLVAGGSSVAVAGQHYGGPGCSLTADQLAGLAAAVAYGIAHPTTGPSGNVAEQFVYIGADCCLYVNNSGNLQDLVNEQGGLDVLWEGVIDLGILGSGGLAGQRYLTDQGVMCGGSPKQPIKQLCPDGSTPPCPPPPPVLPISTSCPPPVINIPPCPPPFLPDQCVLIDLCNWQALCDALKNCLTQATQSGDCALDNDDAWALSDCDGSFGKLWEEWAGDAWQKTLAAPTYVDAATPLQDLTQPVDATHVAGSNPFAAVPV